MSKHNSNFDQHCTKPQATSYHQPQTKHWFKYGQNHDNPYQSQLRINDLEAHSTYIPVATNPHYSPSTIINKI